MKFIILEKFRGEIRKLLDDEQFYHSLGTMFFMQILAFRHDINPLKAGITGILHDCARNFPEQKLAEKLAQREFDVCEEDIDFPALYHAHYGAYLAETRFKIKDKEIINAIRFHPTGAENATTIGKLLFISDYCEPSRHFENLKPVRLLAKENLNKAYIEVLNRKIAHIENCRKPINPRAYRVQEDILNKMKKNKQRDAKMPSKKAKSSRKGGM